MRRAVFIIGAAAIIAGGGVAGAVAFRDKPKPASASSGAARIGGPFSLVDVGGRPVTEKDLLGKPTAIYFGFTYCPEVCPTTLAAMTNWLKALGPAADKLNLVFVSIDPERDTPKQLALYLTNFDHRIRGFTGSADQVRQAARAYRVYYRKVATGGDGYTMDHSTTVYLMDRDGKFADVIGYKEPDADAIAKLKQLVGDAR